MVVRGWGGPVGTALGTAAAAGAAQLGVGYGTGVIAWQPPSGGDVEVAWYTALVWAVWVAASSTVIGAVVAQRLAGPGTDHDRTLPAAWRWVIASAAALGAAVTVLLVAVPSRLADVAATSAPHTSAAGHTVLGVVVGLLLGVGALAARAVAANLLAFTGWLWALAVAAVITGLVAGDDRVHSPLGYWEFDATGPWFRNILLLDAAVPVGAALVLGLLAALPAARRGDRPVEVVLSGGAGPVLVSLAYLAAQPDLTAAASTELSRSLLAPYLVVVGLLGALLASAVPQRRPAPEDGATADGAAGDTAAAAGQAPAEDALPGEGGAQRGVQGSATGSAPGGATDGDRAVPSPRSDGD